MRGAPFRPQFPARCAVFGVDFGACAVFGLDFGARVWCADFGADRRF